MYFKADYPSEAVAVLQYDLDYPAPGIGDGHVTVDKGWLKVATGTSTDSNDGVTVTTRKVVHIDPLPPVAQKVFVCVMGYGQAAMEMLLGGAIDDPRGAIPWNAEPAPLQGDQAAQPGSAGTAGTAPTGTGGSAAPTTAAGLAVSMLSDYFTEVTNDSSKLAAKFASQELTVDDLATFGAKMGARMASAPWRFVQELAGLSPPPPAGGPTQGGANP
jgi:hypothetical protein